MSADFALARACCAVACAEAWRGDGEILASPIGVLPSLGARLARRRRSRRISLLTDGVASPRDRDGDDRGLDALPARVRHGLVRAAPRHDGREPDRPLRQPEHRLHRRHARTRRRSSSACAARRATRSTTRRATGSRTTRPRLRAARSMSSAASATTAPPRSGRSGALPRAAPRRHEPRRASTSRRPDHAMRLALDPPRRARWPTSSQSTGFPLVVPASVPETRAPTARSCGSSARCIDPEGRRARRSSAR